ncbi:MAG TPA: CGNR zinc finger domain-containing protein [Microbacteriaceae bacterium]|nr:CGNR zinc finger domain-containing protein [Microbacteriaceae bacterium]
MERPLVGEPLAVDLVDTRWHGDAGDEDLLATPAGLTQWLRERGLDSPLRRPAEGAGDPSGEPGGVLERMRAALLHTRAVLRRAFEGEARAQDGVNEVLAHAVIVRSLEAGRVRDIPMFPDEAWRPAWLAADDYVRLLQAAPDGIRKCGNPSCVLYFFDPGGRRRWCSMARCGNRLKAQRHYARTRLAARPEM